MTPEQMQTITNRALNQRLTIDDMKDYAWTLSPESDGACLVRNFVWLIAEVERLRVENANLKEELDAKFYDRETRHIFKPTEFMGDTCARCGYNFRHEIHKSVEELS